MDKISNIYLKTIRENNAESNLQFKRRYQMFLTALMFSPFIHFGFLVPMPCAEEGELKQQQELQYQYLQLQKILQRRQKIIDNRYRTMKWEENTIGNPYRLPPQKKILHKRDQSQQQQGQITENTYLLQKLQQFLKTHGHLPKTIFLQNRKHLPPEIYFGDDTQDTLILPDIKMENDQKLEHRNSPAVKEQSEYNEGQVWHQQQPIMAGDNWLLLMLQNFLHNKGLLPHDVQFLPKENQFKTHEYNLYNIENQDQHEEIENQIMPSEKYQPQQMQFTQPTPIVEYQDMVNHPQKFLVSEEKFKKSQKNKEFQKNQDQLQHQQREIMNNQNILQNSIFPNQDLLLQGQKIIQNQNWKQLAQQMTDNHDQGHMQQEEMVENQRLLQGLQKFVEPRPKEQLFPTDWQTQENQVPRQQDQPTTANQQGPSTTSLQPYIAQLEDDDPNSSANQNTPTPENFGGNIEKSPKSNVEKGKILGQISAAIAIIQIYLLLDTWEEINIANIVSEESERHLTEISSKVALLFAATDHLLYLRNRWENRRLHYKERRRIMGQIKKKFSRMNSLKYQTASFLIEVKIELMGRRNGVTVYQRQQMTNGLINTILFIMNGLQLFSEGPSLLQGAITAAFATLPIGNATIYFLVTECMIKFRDIVHGIIELELQLESISAHFHDTEDWLELTIGDPVLDKPYNVALTSNIPVSGTINTGGFNFSPFPGSPAGNNPPAMIIPNPPAMMTNPPAMMMTNPPAMMITNPPTMMMTISPTMMSNIKQVYIYKR